MRNKLLQLNTISALANQIIIIVCGFILPRQILQTFGSEVNGLVNSIAQFLQVIVFLELGVGAVVQSSLYKPLAQKDNASISKIIVSAQRFFNKLATILLVYVLVLIVVYPFVVRQDYGWLYTASLIAAISISSFAQYYFGIVDSLLLNADQHGYVQYTANLISVILNTVACVVLIKVGAGIHAIKLTTSIIYLLRPLTIRCYILKHYQLDRHIQYGEEPIKQKWNGVAQHIAAVVLEGTDNIVLTLFASLSDVSVYSVYHLIIIGVKNLLLSLTRGIQSLLGELWAKKETDSLTSTFAWMEWLIHTATVFIFGCTGVLVLPFVSVYTEGVRDADYLQPLFAALITMAHAGHCLRLPYSIMILAAGHYRETQRNYSVSAIMNIILSVVLVISYGLIGVAIGTLAAMIYQTFWMAHYVSKNTIKWPFKNFIKQILVDCLCVILAVILTRGIKLTAVNYVAWVFMGVKVAVVWLIVIFTVNFFFYRERLTQAAQRFARKKI